MLPVPGNEEQKAIATLTIFRGHYDPSFRLMSRLERKLEHTLEDPVTKKVERVSTRKQRGLAWYDSVCRDILDSFRRYAAGRQGYDAEAEDDVVWALGRHFGLITPLLDWTESPYVAAFFAFEEFRKRLEIHTYGSLSAEADYVHVWGLRFWEDIEKKDEFEVVRASPYAASRQRAQSGLFTRLRSLNHLDIQAYLDGIGKAHLLELYEISGDAAVHAVRDLALMNITEATLFPDLTGAALEANFASDTVYFNTAFLADVQKPSRY